MSWTFDEPKVIRLATELAEVTGETVTEAVVKALEERLTRERREVLSRNVRAELRAIRRRCDAAHSRSAAP